MEKEPGAIGQNAGKNALQNDEREIS